MPVDWNPLIAALAVLVGAVAAAVPSIIVVLQHRSTRAAIAQNSRTLERIDDNTNGAVDALQAAIVSLRAEVVRQAALLDAKSKEPPHGSP